MSLGTDITDQVKNILSTPWNVRDGRGVPKTADISLKDGAVKLNATVLYADLANSTQLAWKLQPGSAGKIIKAFLYAASRLIRANSGVITSFDGDRVMGIYLGDLKNTNAATTALQINWAMKKVIEPLVSKQFTALESKGLTLAHAVGIDTSDVLAIRAGMRDDNDLVWIGRAPGLAAKLSNVREARYRSYVTADVYKVLAEKAKLSSSSKDSMWEKRTSEIYGLEIYRSAWTWTVA